MSKKYHVMRRVSLDEHFTEFITQQLGMYVSECKQLRYKAAKAAKLQQSKPWVPQTKNNIQVSAVKRGAKKTVAVFDPCINMVIKQYTSMNSAGLAAIFLRKAGYESEIPSVTINAVKGIIHKSANDPSLSLFGYRWMCIDDLRSGKFTLASNTLKDATIKKVCTITAITMAEFVSVESAYKDWLEFKKSRLTLPSADEKNSIEYFKEKFIDGTEDVDGITWKRHEHEKAEPDSAVKVEPADMNPSNLVDGNEDGESNDRGVTRV